MEPVRAMWSSTYGPTWFVVSASVAGDAFAAAMVSEHYGRAASDVGRTGHLSGGPPLGFGNFRRHVRWRRSRFQWRHVLLVAVACVHRRIIMDPLDPVVRIAKLGKGRTLDNPRRPGECDA